MKQCSILVLKLCTRVQVSLCNLSRPSGFGGKAGSEVSAGCVFPGGVLAALALVGGRAEAGEDRSRNRCLEPQASFMLSGLIKDRGESKSVK